MVEVAKRNWTSGLNDNISRSLRGLSGRTSKSGSEPIIVGFVGRVAEEAGDF